jgi:hypothetical protein
VERVAFLVEDTGERIACMLNPEVLLKMRAQQAWQSLSRAARLQSIEALGTFRRELPRGNLNATRIFREH